MLDAKIDGYQVIISGDFNENITHNGSTTFDCLDLDFNLQHASSPGELLVPSYTSGTKGLPRYVESRIDFTLYARYTPS